MVPRRLLLDVIDNRQRQGEGSVERHEANRRSLTSSKECSCSA